MLRFDRKQQNSLKQLSFNKKIKKKSDQRLEAELTTKGHEEKGGEGEVYGKSHMETYITIRKIDSQQELLYGSGNSNRDSVSIQ